MATTGAVMSGRPINWIVIHTAAADRAGVTRDEIDRWHRQRGFAEIGYHWIIEDGGNVEIGRDEMRIGAHAHGFNSDSIGVCVTGHGDLYDFNAHQYAALIALVREIMTRYGIDADHVIGHREVRTIAGGPEPGKTCPGTKVNMDAIRSMVRS